MNTEPTVLSTNTICFEAICRVYRNAVVAHIRKVFIATYPTYFLEKLTTPFQKEWDEIKRNAEMSRKTGELRTELKDDFDYLDVHHFPNLFDKYFDDLFPGNQGVNAEDRKALRGRIRDWSGEIKRYRDPVLGHPADDDISIDDAQRLLDSAQRVLRNVDQSSEQEIGRLKSSLQNGVDMAEQEVIREPRILEASTLPSRETIAPSFVGRKVELDILHKWINDPDSSMRILAGDGGKGKTAIAYEFAVTTRNDAPEPLETVIWLSAKAKRFAAGKTVDIESPDFSDLNSALDWVLHAYGVANDEIKSTQEKEKQCLEYLGILPALIIIDDVDSLENEGLAAATFFTGKVQATKSKVLLTSRRRFWHWEHMTTRVAGLIDEDGTKFIDSRIGLFELDPKQFNNRVKNRILRACDGSPLFIEDLLRLCKLGEPPANAIKSWEEGTGDNARQYALRREFEGLTDLAKTVLLACALYPGSISLREIELAANKPEDECRTAIEELQGLFLIPQPQQIEDLPRFALNLNTERLVIDVLGDTDLAHRISSDIRAITGEAQATVAQRGKIGEYIRQAITLSKLNEHSKAETTLLSAIDAFPGNPDLYASLGRVYKHWKPDIRYTDARSQFVRAAELNSKKEDTFWHWCDLEMQQSEWTAATKAAEMGLEVKPSSMRLAFMAGFACSQLSKDLYQQGLYSRSKQEALRADQHLKNALINVEQIESGEYTLHSRAYRASTLNYERLVRISTDQQDPTDAKRYVDLLAKTLKQWGKEHPTDPNTSSEGERLVRLFPTIGDVGATV